MTTPQRSANIAPGPFWALASPIGRMSREPFWLCFLFMSLVFAIPLRIWLLSSPVPPSPEALMAGDYLSSNPLFPIVYFVIQWFLLAILIKRLQDLGLSGFLALLVFVPLLDIIMVIALGLLPGQAAPNRHGPLSNSYWRKR
jgi:uncharacterized membrane protein YhaH (DUF805 family)